MIGFDDREIAQYTRPPLTTLILPHYEMGANATEILLDRANRMTARPEQLKVECHLVERLSISAVSRRAVDRHRPAATDGRGQMRILVTGATGKVGQTLIARLAAVDARRPGSRRFATTACCPKPTR